MQFESMLVLREKSSTVLKDLTLIRTHRDSVHQL